MKTIHVSFQILNLKKNSNSVFFFFTSQTKGQNLMRSGALSILVSLGIFETAGRTSLQL